MSTSLQYVVQQTSHQYHDNEKRTVCSTTLNHVQGGLHFYDRNHHPIRSNVNG
jgi:hypothetical protein